MEAMEERPVANALVPFSRFYFLGTEKEMEGQRVTDAFPASARRYFLVAGIIKSHCSSPYLDIRKPQHQIALVVAMVKRHPDTVVLLHIFPGHSTPGGTVCPAEHPLLDLMLFV